MTTRMDDLVRFVHDELVYNGNTMTRRRYRDLIAGEILATSFEFGEPTDGVEIGDGVRVSIAKV